MKLKAFSLQDTRFRHRLPPLNFWLACEEAYLPGTGATVIK